MKEKWDLSVLYKDENSFYKECDVIREELNELKKLNDSCFDNADNLYNYLCFNTEVSIKIEKLYSYASMNYDLDTSNNKAMILEEKARNLYEEYEKIIAFFTPDFLNLDRRVVDKFYRDNDKLNEYRIILDRVYRYKEHTLSKQEEKLLSELSSVFDRSSKTYEVLTDCDMTFGVIKDEEGNDVEITHSNYSRYLESNNREVRKSAFEMMYKGYKGMANTINSCYFAEVNELYTMSRIKKYDSIIDMLVFDDEVDKGIYKNLVDVVNKKMDINYSYFKLLKDNMKLDELHLYDTYASIISGDNFKYSYKEAVDIVLKALNVLGEDYTNILKNGYENGWVDVYPSKAKRSGAYSGGSYLTDPYILLNFEGRYNDVSTLAHESGHSMHSYYTRTNNNAIYGNYRIFVAEVASTVNELLLANYMLNNTDSNDEKIFILNKLMGLYKATIYRQTMFAEFEEIAFNMVENGEVLTQEVLCDKYYELNKKYFGDAVVIDSDIRYEWLRIPHFYYKFYVYKYAIGLSAATHIVKRLLSDNTYKDKYIQFLSCGSKLSPNESLKLADVDLTKPEVVESALDYFKEIQDEFIKLCNNE